MTAPRRTVISSDVREILNYFGKCPLCGYPARASTYTAQFDDGNTEEQVVATCGLPCGWNGPANATTMTGTDPIPKASRKSLPPNPAHLAPRPERETS
ncbi:hypothetical protein OHB26_31500 [Nocardia sp. NBC_01503]|uniref:hypothetical protein n=1 Tax=Nocardia sp. NBC_01503 TaxID=2975997 RepID=UPI002E7ABFD0|nr:hypothetical protein [Nocardia sp. NBC_01503]WTL31398.1 hypothetical protein OHB26_31500 [Nocardia sp. NBC_01503]